MQGIIQEKYEPYKYGHALKYNISAKAESCFFTMWLCRGETKQYFVKKLIYHQEDFDESSNNTLW